MVFQDFSHIWKTIALKSSYDGLYLEWRKDRNKIDILFFQVIVESSETG